MQTETDHGPTLISIMIGVYFLGLFIVDTGARVLAHLLGVFSV